SLVFTADVDLAAQVAGLAAAEQECCPFFTFTVRLTTGQISRGRPLRSPPGEQAPAGASRLEDVADAGLGDDVPGVCRVVLELSAEQGGVHAQVVGLVGVPGPPDLLEQLHTAHEPTAVANQDLEHRPLRGAQSHLGAVPEHASA